MMPFHLNRRDKGPLNVLCLGAHSDDIEIGCGGTLLQIQRWYPQIAFHWVVFSAIGPRRDEACQGAQSFTAGMSCKPVLKEFQDGFLPYMGREVKQTFEELKTEVQPDIIFTHSASDAHQDHRLLSELTWNTFRNHFILEYEIPKYDGDMARPNFFVPLEDSVRESKIELLMNTFPSQRQRGWFQPETFSGLMRVRGMECNAPSGYAEAFNVRKVVLAA
jgi:LmbE family N-acetylglucosaminyl deacetylase